MHAEVNPATILKHYRGIFIFNKDLNTGFGIILIPFLKLGLILAFVFSLFAAVRLRDDLDELSFAMVAVVVLTSAALTVPTTIIMSSLYDVSSQFKGNMLPILDRISHPIDKKYAKSQMESVQLIRCSVGNLYHMEAKAKLTMVNHVVNGLVFMLVNTR